MIDLENYPEHKKLVESETELKNIVNFLEWMFDTRRFALTKRRQHRIKIVHSQLGDWLLSEYFDIDLEELYKEKRELEENINSSSSL